ncbi:hypothetical protein [Cytobacillus pseudoceanisediminis]|uniref:hypothetical protein n=1 Tax=Cytobacillus pseudoceanisediminis TaxID=3051614 RepID=UPI003CEFF2B2
MREPNLGCYITCCVCGRRFWTEDGLPLCSSACDRRFEEWQEEQEREEKIRFCEESNAEFGAYPEDTDFEYMTDEELDEAVEFLDYLWTK